MSDDYEKAYFKSLQIYRMSMGLKLFPEAGANTMSDEEFINEFEKAFAFGPGDTLYRIIELARIGASVKPRPIEEAPEAP